MPNCFTLTRKNAPEAGPVVLNTIDNEMCAYFGVTPDQERYYCYWYDIIGFKLALGKSWDQIKEDLKVILAQYEKEELEHERQFQSRLLEIANWLEENFTTNAWYGHKSML